MSENETEYTCVEAKVCVDRGKLVQADIMEAAHITTDELAKIQNAMLPAYWDLHSRIAAESFYSEDEQLAALEKIGQFAIALKAVRDACSAFRVVRCF